MSELPVYIVSVSRVKVEKCDLSDDIFLFENLQTYGDQEYLFLPKIIADRGHICIDSLVLFAIPEPASSLIQYGLGKVHTVHKPDDIFPRPNTLPVGWVVSDFSEDVLRVIREFRSNMNPFAMAREKVRAFERCANLGNKETAVSYLLAAAKLFERD